jgi:hypothetical protein
MKALDVAGTNGDFGAAWTGIVGLGVLTFPPNTDFPPLTSAALDCILAPAPRAPIGTIGRISSKILGPIPPNAILEMIGL